MKKTRNYNTAFLHLLLICIIAACNTTPRNIPFPQQESEFSNPTTEKLTFSEPAKLSWKTINPESVKPILTEKFDLNKIPSKKIDINNAIPVARKIKDTLFEWKNIPDSAFNLDDLPSVKLNLKTAILGKPRRVKSGLPRLKDGATESFLLFGQDQGLPGTVGNCMLQDKDGIMWIGTDNGLCRFDGEYCEIYSLEQGLKGTNITKLFEDSHGQIWLSYFGVNGLSVLNRSTRIATHLTTEDGIIGIHNITCFLEDRKGMIWISTENGINIIDEKDRTIRHLSNGQGLRNTFIPDLLQDSQDRIWIAAQSSGIDVIDRKEGRIRHIGSALGAGNNNVSHLVADNAGQIWIGTYDGGIKVLNEKMGIIKQVINYDDIGNNSVEGMTFDKDDKIWIRSTNSGVFIFNTKDETIKHLTTAQGLSNDNVVSLYSDTHGQIWIGTYGGEIAIYNTNSGSLLHLTSARGFSNKTNLFYAFTEDNQSRVWIGSAGGVDIIDEKKGTIKSISAREGLSANNVINLFTDSRGRVWILSYPDKVDVIDEGAGTIKHFGSAHGFNFYSNGSIIEDNQGQIWIGKGRIYVLNEKKGIIKYAMSSQEIFEGWIDCMLIDRHGQVWISAGNSIYVFDEKTESIKSIISKEFQGVNFYNLIEDSQGRIWISSYGNGLFMIDQNRTTLTNFSLSSGLADMAVASLNERKGSIYAGTERGLTVITPDIKKTKWQIKSYGKPQGFLRVDHNPRSLVSKDGRLWLAISDVLTIMGEPKKDSLIPSTFISALDINEQPQNFISNKWIRSKLQGVDTIWNAVMDTFYTKYILPADTGYHQKKNITWDSISGAGNMPVNLHLPYHQKHLTFHFTGVHLDNLNKTRYRYVLEGNDEAWSQITGNAYADYRNLSPGEYTFRVSSRGFNGFWSTPAELSFTISPPWWLTTWAYLLYGLIFLISLSTFIRWRLSSLKKEKQILEEKVAKRTTQLKAEKEKVENTLEELKSTQSQLIQREKMASLGELTAGIAHEIQNPLNFVNNFSEINKELITDLKNELRNGNTIEVFTIADNIEGNEEKIIYHGQRADAIVKSMLQHSRAGSGKKEPTDINALADEYLRLAYHGMRAKDKTFNATLHTDFDATLQKINVIPQDIGRVLLNLFKNAFYAVNEKKQSAPDGYEPAVYVSTKKIENKIVIAVKDNGNGIPNKIKDKIFQPFFTTKPTGKGTGLGLSLSYDIVKAHGGEIRVESTDGKETTLHIYLPSGT